MAEPGPDTAKSMHLRHGSERTAQIFYSFPVFALAHIRILYKNTVCSYN